MFRVDFKCLRLEAAWKSVLLGNSWQSDEVLQRIKWLQSWDCLLSLRSQYHSVCGSSVPWSVTSSSPPPALPFSFHLTYPSPRPSVIPLNLGKTGFKGERGARWGRRCQGNWLHNPKVKELILQLQLSGWLSLMANKFGYKYDKYISANFFYWFAMFSLAALWRSDWKQ